MTKASLTIDEKIDVVLTAPTELRNRLTLTLAMDAAEQKKIAKFVKAYALCEASHVAESGSSTGASLAQHPPQKELQTSNGIKKRFDGFELVEAIDSGSFGEVWKAKQVFKETKRWVAVKILHDPKSRFRDEITSLSECDHANVVHLYGFGQVDGRSYLAMEYIPKGDALKYCTDQQLGLRERLDLFVEICDGVEHLHKKGIVHNDLKPSNILMSSVGRPRIADFGLSAQELIEPRFLMDDINQLAARGTIEYASPEALDLSKVADTRSDVYSLGVILFELLIGESPFSINYRCSEGEFADRPSGDLPEQPSLLSQFVANEKRVLGEKATQTLRGDLDSIILKAISHDPKDRYGNVNDLTHDVRAYLSHDCVIARDPSPPLYKTQKFIRKRPAIAAFLAALLLSGVYLVVLSIQLSLSNKALDGANQEIAQRVVDLEEANRKEKAATQEALAGKRKIETQASNLKSINSVLQTVFEGFNPHIATASDGELRGELIGRMTKVAKEIMEKQLGMDDDGVQMKKHLAETLNVFGQLETSIQLWEHISRDSQQRKGRSHEDTLAGLLNLGRTQLRTNPAEALETMLEVKHVAGELYEEDHLAFDEIDHVLAEAYSKTGELGLASQTLEGIIDRMATSDETKAGLYIDVLNSHGSLAIKMRQLNKAEKSLAEAVKIGKQYFSESHLLVLAIRQNLVMVRNALGEKGEVIADSREILKLFRSQMPEDSPQVVGAKHQLATYLASKQTQDESIQLFQEIIDGKGPLPNRLQAELEMNTVRYLFTDNQPEKRKAVAEIEGLLERTEAKLGTQHPVTVQVQYKARKYRDELEAMN